MTAPVELVQGSPEWIKARVGSLGASRVHDAIARTKSGWGASRANLMAELVAERLTGIPAEAYVNAAMAWGTATEPEARDIYALVNGVEVREVGLVPHPKLLGTHASPDGLVGDDGLVEIKCPGTATHLDFLLGGGIPAKYLTQMRWQMACTGRQWCDFVSFDPRLPENAWLQIVRVHRQPKEIGALEVDVAEFLAELETLVEKVRAHGAPTPVFEPDFSGSLLMAG